MRRRSLLAAAASAAGGALAGCLGGRSLPPSAAGLDLSLDAGGGELDGFARLELSVESVVFRGVGAGTGCSDDQRPNGSPPVDRLAFDLGRTVDLTTLLAGSTAPLARLSVPPTAYGDAFLRIGSVDALLRSGESAQFRAADRLRAAPRSAFRLDPPGGATTGLRIGVLVLSGSSGYQFVPSGGRVDVSVASGGPRLGAYFPDGDRSRLVVTRGGEPAPNAPVVVNGKRRRARADGRLALDTTECVDVRVLAPGA